jgi:formyltetrahydrofolate synthetase
VTLEDVGVAGAMAALLRDALEPNLLQTVEGGPALVHGTSWAHLALGSCSVVAELCAAGLVDAVVTESGYGADLGAEKYFDIKCRASGIIPVAAVLVATVRGQRIHGVENLSKQIGNVLLFGIPVVVAVNPFPGDAASDLDTLVRGALAAGAQAAVVCDHHARGGEGAVGLARAAWSAAQTGGDGFRPLYPDDLPLVEKIEMVAGRVYGASGIDLVPAAQRRLAELQERGFGVLPICMAKTPYSLSHDPTRAGRPSGFRLPIGEIRLAAGAGYVTAVAGDVAFMPGLPEHPGGESIGIDPAGNIAGLV